MTTTEIDFLNLIDSLGDRIIGTERSLKISASSFDAGRLLCGVDSKGINCNEFIKKLSPFNPSKNCLEWLQDQWDKSNFLYLAIESADTKILFNESLPEIGLVKSNPVIKVYLEFPVLLSTQTNDIIVHGEKALWCTGYKWSPHTFKERVTHYYLRPDLNLTRLNDLDVFKKLLTHDQHNLTLLSHYLRQQNQELIESIDILEVDNPLGSKGIDLRLYSLNKRVQEIAHVVHDIFPLLAHHPNYPIFNQYVLEKNQQYIGHISLGYDLVMAHFTFYWEFMK
ncbi:MAG: hypothetical protein EA373_04415 [Oceanospirillales bacterium]|nr:MAG: hypothetical protein EA373_04415 [Oceanospirillales bacterium]